MPPTWNDQHEWLETDGLGGFAMGTAGGIRTRRYHGLLTVARRPPTDRFMLVNGLEVVARTPAGSYPLSSHRYDGQVVHPDGHKRILSFTSEPWPTWRFTLGDGIVIEQQLFVRHEAPVVAIAWRAAQPSGPLTLDVRPLLSGRDIHALHHENASFNFDATPTGKGVRWQPYAGLPGVLAYANGSYRHAPLWYRRFFYQEEWLRGFDATEDLASPGAFTFDLAAGEAVLILATTGERPVRLPGIGGTAGATAGVRECLNALRDAEARRRSAFASPIHRAANQYLVRRGTVGRSVIAGYPWFADWGRDTFVSLRGLCVATDRLDDARQILLAWADYVSDGMLPNRFPDAGEAPEYNSVDAALWYVIAAHAFLDAADARGYFVQDSTRDALHAAVDAILTGYARGTRHGIRADDDGLLAAGAPGVQLTWMDAKICDWVVTPRTGKAVDVNALWLNALHLAARHTPRWAELFGRGRLTFRRRFWDPSTRGLFDVVDVDHDVGRCDASCRPNQVFAVGGLPIGLLDDEQARAVVDQVERRLWTPLGLRSLAPDAPGYAARYTGGPRDRDAVYHQGTVWPWLIGPFVEAWVRVRGNTPAAKSEARRRFVAPLRAHLNESGLGHVSEITDGDAPHMPRGCPFQAWSVAGLLRLELDVLADEEQVQPRSPRRHPTVDQPRVVSATSPS